MKIKISFFLTALSISMNVIAQQPLIIERQGSFSVGGKTIQHDGKYDNSKFVGWATQVETGQSTRVDHAFVNYQIPVNSKRLSLIFVHGIK